MRNLIRYRHMMALVWVMAIGVWVITAQNYGIGGNTAGSQELTITGDFTGLSLGNMQLDCVITETSSSNMLGFSTGVSFTMRQGVPTLDLRNPLEDNDACRLTFGTVSGAEIAEHEIVFNVGNPTQETLDELAAMTADDDGDSITLPGGEDSDSDDTTRNTTTAIETPSLATIINGTTAFDVLSMSQLIKADDSAVIYTRLRASDPITLSDYNIVIITTNFVSLPTAVITNDGMFNYETSDFSFAAGESFVLQYEFNDATSDEEVALRLSDGENEADGLIILETIDTLPTEAGLAAQVVERVVDGTQYQFTTYLRATETDIDPASVIINAVGQEAPLSDFTSDIIAAGEERVVILQFELAEGLSATFLRFSVGDRTGPTVVVRFTS